MKPIIKFISLLLYSGLILPFYNCTNSHGTSIPGPSNHISSKSTASPNDQPPVQLIIYEAIADRYFPEFKN